MDEAGEVMTDSVGKALMLPWARGLLTMPARAAFLRAEADPALPADLLCEQSFKPAYDALAAAGHPVTRAIEGTFELILCRLTGDKAENRANLARAWRHLVPGGTLVVGGTRETGAVSLEAEVAATLPLAGSLAKYHCRVFWLRRDADALPPGWSDWRDAAEPAPHPGPGYLTRPGMFSWREIDPGSRLLAEALPGDLAGRGADLGAGWGYLAVETLRRAAPGCRLDLYEAEALALDAAAVALARAGLEQRAEGRWHDVAATPLPARLYDFVVMNPPFHRGKTTDVSLGQAFIAQAARALRPGGRLLLVANRQLPYERILREHFPRITPLAETGLYKVIAAAL